MRLPFRLPRLGRLRNPVTPRLRSRFEYAPVADDRPDPGEVVWTWVPYEEDPARGKDRPVLVIGYDGPAMLALQLTGQDHDLDAAQEAASGRLWMDLGSGSWDARGRPSEVRLNRLLRLDPMVVRRDGGQVGREVFEAVLDAAAPHLPDLRDPEGSPEG